MTLPAEEEVARRWWSLVPGTILPCSDGRRYQLLFAGHPGGSSGPDVRDAVLCSVPETAQRLVGDVEFHVRAGDWLAHRHHTDARYNRVILHIVLRYDGRSTPRQDGQSIPICSLYDLAFASEQPSGQTIWPCYTNMADTVTRQRLLHAAGLERFELKAQTFIEQLRSLSEQFPGAFPVDHYDLVLIPALAEGLGYGRDRQFFRAIGLFMLGLGQQLPEPLGRGEQPSPLDEQRLRVLRTIVQNWRGVWKRLRLHLLLKDEGNVSLQALRYAFTSLLQYTETVQEQYPRPTSSPRALVYMGKPKRSIELAPGLSLARTDILIVNVLLPFSLAVAIIEHDEILAQRAYSLYEQHPGLTSNRITRMMCAQLCLPGLPSGSCQQQGLHHIYQQTCREKHCAVCSLR